MNNNTITILDCTLRDGGYYNKWDFDREVVDHYLKGIKAASIDVVDRFSRFHNQSFKRKKYYEKNKYQIEFEKLYDEQDFPKGKYLIKNVNN